MKTTRRPAPAALTTDECRIRASLLLKDLRCDDARRAERAAERFRALAYFSSHEPDVIVARRDSIQLKHALAVIAAELGYATWNDCKRRLDTPSHRRIDTERFFAAHGCGFLNRWFARYDEACASLEAHGGYLFPYRHQFFICEWGFLDALGIDPADPDWERIGCDWVRPRDEAARDRLERTLIALGYGGARID
jgi:hypothetical protein